MANNFVRRLGLVVLACRLGQACTIGVFSSRVTVDRRPFIWKNRDVANPDQAVRFFRGGRFDYLGEIYAGDTTEVWAGLNSAGFGIMNSNSFNLGAGATEGMGDGALMKLALQTCGSIQDFEQLMDSVNNLGLKVPCNLGVIDATGATAMFEAGAHSYVRIEADSVPERYVVRANFSARPDSLTQRSYERYARACALVARGIAAQEFCAQYLIENIARDLGTIHYDPYPLPFRGRVDSLPFGFLPASTTISRTTTRAGIFIVGPGPGEPGNLAAMWVMLGEPVVAVAVPLWVASRSVPGELTDNPQAELCAAAQRLRTYVYSDPTLPGAINTFRVAEVDEFFGATKHPIYEQTTEQQEVWRTHGAEPTELAEFQNWAAAKALTGYLGFWERDPDPAPLVVVLPNDWVSYDRSAGVVRFVLPDAPDNRTLAIYSPVGRRLVLWVLDRAGQDGSGNRVLTWSVKGLSQGTYFAVLDQKTRRLSRRLSLIR